MQRRATDTREGEGGNCQQGQGRWNDGRRDERAPDDPREQPQGIAGW
jgi:hypothetical protein